MGRVKRQPSLAGWLGATRVRRHYSNSVHTERVNVKKRIRRAMQELGITPGTPEAHELEQRVRAHFEPHKEEPWISGL